MSLLNFSPENRPRKPIKGVRIQFRTAVRAAGIQGRFSTDFRRRHPGGTGPVLVVACHSEDTADGIRILFSEFQGYPLLVLLRSEP